MKHKIGADKILIIGIVLLLLSIALVMAFSISESRKVNTTAKLVTNAQEALFRSEKLYTIISGIETRSRGYLHTGQNAFFEGYNKYKKDLDPAFSDLKNLTDEHFIQQRRIDSLHTLITVRIAFADSLIKIKKNISEEELDKAIIAGNSTAFLYEINNIITRLQDEEKKVLEQREKTNRRAEVMQYYIFLILIFLVLFLLIIFFVRVKQIAATEERKRSEAMFKGLLESAPDAIVIVNSSAEIVLTNRQTEKLFGYDKNELVGQPFKILIPEGHILQDVNILLDPKEWTNIAGHELSAVKSNGESFVVEISFATFENDKTKLISAAIRDITERKKIQEQLEFLSLQINRSNDAIYTVDAHSKIKSWSRGAELMYGYSAEEAIGKRSNDILKTSLTDEEIDKALKEISQKDYWSGEFKRKIKSGEEIYVSSSTSTIRDDKGVITGYVAVGYDITEQKKLREQVNHLANIVEQSTEAIISVGFDQRIISWNSGAEKLFGYTKDEVIGNIAIGMGLTPLSPTEETIIFGEILETGAWQQEMNFSNKNGELFFAAASANVVKNEQGELNSIVLIVKDLSLRKQLEEELRKSNEVLEERVKIRTEEVYKNEKRFRALLENTNDVIAVLDEDFQRIYVSPSSERVTGWDNEYMLNTPGVNHVHPEDIAATKAIYNELLNNPGKPVDTLIRSMHKDGHYMWIEGVGINLFHDENVRGIVFNFRDVTERIENQKRIIASEEQFRHSLDSMLEGVQIIDFDWRYIYINDSFTKHAKYTREDLIGFTVMEKFPGIEQTEIYKVYQRCYNERIAIHLENEFLFPDGSMGWFELSFQPVPEGIFILSIDITERKKAQIEIEKLNEDLEQKVVQRTEQLIAANNDLEAFSYSVSHDLRAPLRGIHGFASILDEDYGSKLDDEAKRLISVIQNNASKMGHLIDDLLAFLRMGRHEILKTKVDSNLMVSEIINELDVKNEKNKVELIIHPLPSIKADANTMKQVWINFISNAVKYSRKAEHPVIEIGSIPDDKNDVFYIKDNGVGFDSQYKNKLFKVFQRLHSLNEFEGTGVGLAIVEKIISKHNGKVWAEAEPDKGATFYFSLPK
ncbi:MAG: PAS domain S-box protein [Bacteroidota bacterium]